MKEFFWIVPLLLLALLTKGFGGSDSGGPGGWLDGGDSCDSDGGGDCGGD